MPRRGGVPRAAQDLDREGPKVRVAGRGVVRLRKAHSLGIPGPEQAPGDQGAIRDVEEVGKMEFQSLILKEEAPVATIRLNRPEKRNALSLALMQEVMTALRQVSSDAEMRVIVIEAAGVAFSAGHDLGEMVGREGVFYQRLFDLCSQMMEMLHRVPQPVIAKIHGVATAAGCQLVAACDLAVAAEEARFATPGVKIGLFCSTPMVPVSRAIGRKRALQLLLTWEPIDAATAAEWGLVNRVVPAEELDAAAQEHAGPVALHPPGGIAEHLVAVVEPDLEHPVAEGLDDLALHLDLLFLLGDDASSATRRAQRPPKKHLPYHSYEHVAKAQRANRTRSRLRNPQ